MLNLLSDDEPLVSREQRTRIVASFAEANDAELASERVESLLAAASQDLTELFEAQGGVADVSDVTRIYARYGFTNNSAWEQSEPLRVRGAQLVWDAPAGLDIDEVETLLSTLGAHTVLTQRLENEEPWADAPHPMTVVVTEEEWVLLSQDDDEPSRPSPRAKKVLH